MPGPLRESRTISAILGRRGPRRPGPRGCAGADRLGPLRVDVIVEARARAAGAITVRSRRHGLLPQRHGRPRAAGRNIVGEDGADGAFRLRHLRREAARASAEGGRWRLAVDALRVDRGDLDAAQPRREDDASSATWARAGTANRHRVAPEIRPRSSRDAKREGKTPRHRRPGPPPPPPPLALAAIGDSGLRFRWNRRGSNEVETVSRAAVSTATAGPEPPGRPVGDPRLGARSRPRPPDPWGSG